MHLEALLVGHPGHATRPKSNLTVAATNIGNGSKAPNPFNVWIVNIRLNGARSSSSARQWKRPSPARGAALRMFFVGGPTPARTAPPVRPSAQPFSPSPRSTAGARIKQCGINLAPAAAGKPSTNARPTEMPMKQREPGEHSGPAEEPGPEALPTRFRAPGAGLPPAGPNPQDPRTTGHPKPHAKEITHKRSPHPVLRHPHPRPGAVLQPGRRHPLRPALGGGPDPLRR